MMHSIGMDRLELPIGQPGKLDLPVIVHSALGGRHRKFGIAAVDAEVGPQGCPNKPDVTDIHRLVFEPVDVGIAITQQARVADALLHGGSIVFMVPCREHDGHRGTNVGRQPFDAGGDAARVFQDTDPSCDGLLPPRATRTTPPSI